MPFKSMAQSRYMFAKNSKIAKEFASKTNYSNLPEKIKRKKQKDALSKMANKK